MSKRLSVMLMLLSRVPGGMSNLLYIGSLIILFHRGRESKFSTI